MADSLPPELAHLLASTDDLAREKAWRVFLDAYSPLILHAARSASTGYDEGMDAYTAALDGLRSADYRKLRNYSLDPRSKFSTWLVVVVRRICIDSQRERYGRVSSAEKRDGISDERAARRRLATLTGEAVELSSIADSYGLSPDDAVTKGDLKQQLEDVLGEIDERDRLLLTLRFVDDLSAKRIAELQGWKDQMAVYRRITQLTDTLRQKLIARGVDSPAP